MDGCLIRLEWSDRVARQLGPPTLSLRLCQQQQQDWALMNYPFQLDNGQEQLIQARMHSYPTTTISHTLIVQFI